MKEYFSFQWHITDSCDQRCEHCYIFAEDNNIPLAEMSWDNMQGVLDNCVEMCEKVNCVPYFYITGGDPILHKDFWRLLELLKSREIAFSIMGNPFHLTDEVCRRLKSSGCERYQLSIDGLRDTHDGIRKPGSFDTTIDKIATINKAGIRSVIMTTVSKTNVNEIPAIIDLLVERGVKVFAFARYCPTGPKKDTHVEPDEYRKLLDVCWGKFERYKNCGTTFNLKDHLWTLYLHEKGFFTIPDGLDDDMIYDGCNCGINHLTILPNGDIYACRRMDSIVGNVFVDRMADVFSCEKMDKYRDFGKLEKCSKCELMRFCRGCPAVAYGYTHNLYSADPQCWKEVDYVNEVMKNILERRSIRKYKPEQVRREDLNTILQAGMYAPSAGGRQSPIVVACQNREINKQLGKINHSLFHGRMSTSTAYISKEQPSIADDANIKDGFYGAPTVLTLFAPNNYLYSTADCSVMAQNIMLAAHSLGIGSCMVMRAEDTFSSELGQKLQREWGIDESYQAKVHIALGYPDGVAPQGKARKENRMQVVDG